MTSTDRGHRAVEHTADEIVEAWGPTRAACIEEAVTGLVALFADPGTATTDAGVHEVVFDAIDDERVLVAALDEVVFLADARSVVPVGVEVADEGDALRLRLRLVPADEVVATGPSPKAVSRGGVELHHDGDRWTARALIDL